MRANALTWASIVFISMPLLAYMIHRFVLACLKRRALELECARIGVRVFIM